MAAESQEDGHPLIAEYRERFPEIPEEDLARIVREYGTDPDSCLRILEAESKKCLYGSSPTPETNIKALKVVGPKISPGFVANPGIPADFKRSNSTGSTSSGHSSGRSTPVNQIPTLWVVPNSHASVVHTGYHMTPNQYSNLPTGGMSSGMVYSPVNGSYFYHPLTGAGHHVPTNTPGGIPHYTVISGGKQRPPREAYSLLKDNAYTNIPDFTGAGTRTNQTSPVASYPPQSTAGFYPVNTPNITTPTGSNQTSPTRGSSLTSGAREMCFEQAYYTLPTNQSLPSTYMYHRPVNTDGDQSLYNVSSNPPQFDTRYLTLPAGSPHVPVTATLPSANSTGTRIETPYLATNAGFIPINSLTTVTRPNAEQIYVSTSSEAFVSGVQSSLVRQGIPSPEEYRRSPFSGIGPTSTASRQPVANDEYLKACLSQQCKRLQNLRKEYDIDKERLEILIKEISDRDHELYNQRYRVAPNPSNEQIRQLTLENEHLKRTIDEIQKNIDRVENGQDVLRPADPRVHTTHRIIPSQRPKEPYDRSNSVPCLPACFDNGQKPPLGRPLSEHDLNINLEQRTVQYRLTPPSDPSLEDWSLVNQELTSIPLDPNTRPTHNDEGVQWSCSQCTFLNHESLLACEMCSASR